MEQLKHECGVAMIRLLKPLEYYEKKYGTWMYGLNKLYLLMEKQHNRGQEGAGLACVKLEASPGCLLYTSPSPRDISGSRMPSSA